MTEQTAVDDFAQNLIPHLLEVPFADGMAVLVKTLRAYPLLEDTIWDVRPGRDQLEIRVLGGFGVAVFQMWAPHLTDLSTSAYRYESSVDAEMSGLLRGRRVRIVGLIPADSVPEGAGAHEWTLPEVTA